MFLSFQAQGICVSIFLFVAWTLSGYCRRLQHRKVLASKATNRTATMPSSQQTQNKSEWPPISVVLPVRGVRSNALEYWESQVTCAYPGHVEFVFTVDGGEDPAIVVLKGLQKRMASNGMAAGPFRIHVAGLSTTCSQKIHNQISGFGAASKESRFVS